jgi:hypothetical protein
VKFAWQNRDDSPIQGSILVIPEDCSRNRSINKDNIRGFKCVMRMSAKPASVATHPAAGNFDLTAGRRRA